MKTLLASLLLAAAVTPAVAGPDFVTKSPEARELASSSGERTITPLDDVVFAYNSHALDPNALAQLESAAKWMRKNSKHRMVVEGFADSTGYAVYNEDLSTRRAAIVRNHLIALGVPRDRIVMVMYGESVARGGRDPLDRRVVMYASKLKPRQIALKSLEHKSALSAVWTEKGTLFRETKPGLERVSKR